MSDQEMSETSTDNVECHTQGGSFDENSNEMDLVNHDDRRSKKLTQKGKDWQLQVLQGKLRTSSSQWKKQAVKCLKLLSDCEDCEMLRNSRAELESCFVSISNIGEELSNITEFDVSNLVSKFEQIESEHLNIMSQYSSAIRSVALEKGTARSRSSKHSLSEDTVVSVAAKAASLKAKLRFIDIESKLSADLKRIKTMKELEMATAQVQALEQAQPFPSSGISISEVKQLPHDDMNNYVSEYLKNQSLLKQESPVDNAYTPTLENQNTNVLSLPNPVLAKHDTETQESKIQQTFSPLNPTATSFVPHVEATVADNETSRVQSINQSLVDLAKSLAEQVSLNRLPVPEPNVFNGDPIQYPAWKTAFKTLIDQRNIPPGERIHYLKRYLGGSVKQVIENYFLLPSDDAYEEAKKLLDERYGDPFVVTSAFRDKLESWPKVQSKDSVGLMRFADFLKQCDTAMQSVHGLAILNDCHENRKMLSKLPDWIVVRWNRVVANHKESTCEFPSFKLFVEFITKEAKIASDPVTSVQSLRDNQKSDVHSSQGLKSSRNGTKSFGGRSFLAESKETGGGSSVETKKDFTNSCLCCDRRFHELDDCRVFLGKPLEDRKSLLKTKRLCFGCLSPGHISKRCKQRKKCKICSKLHPTSLHGDKHVTSVPGSDHVPASKTFPQTTDTKVKSGTTFLSSSGAECKCSAIVPVYVSCKTNPNREILVYALLDSQSDTSFILKDTCNKLGLSGVSVNLSLSTMLSEDQLVSSQKIKGLLVRGHNSNKQITVPEAYSRNIMPANRSHIPTPEVARAWPHLEEIASNLLPLNNCEIGLLIGYNCSQALLPREIIPPLGEGPFGQRTDLGWSIVGIVQYGHETEDSVGVSHRIVTCEIPSELLSSNTPCTKSVRFSLKTSVKEIVSTDVLKLMEREFFESSCSDASVSQEDASFLSTLKHGLIFRDGQYEMPLPFKQHKPSLPNNRVMAVSRLRPLQRRLQSDERFRKHYTDFMTDLFQKGHAERVSDPSPVDKTVWYIPHHGVYHHLKPNKIRVVFDCSASFKGHSLNQYLLQGPDLTNRLVGVLCRFRKEAVAVSCDIEQMFYQFKVTADCRDYLRFLWWESDDYTKDPVDCRMTVHLFGATSSPGCANFGLKQLAADHETTFGSEVAQFINHDFYVDDGLKSLPTVQEAKDLIEGTKAMCSKAGIRLHKFVSNSMEVMESIHPDDRAKNLQTIELASDKAPIERALGISWCIESDTFQFRIILKDRPLTRRGLLSSVGCLYDPLGLISPVVLLGKQILQQMCSDKADWDDPLPENLHDKWLEWANSLHSLSGFKVPRCLKPKDFGEVSKVELHSFSDASTVGYGQCSYVRFISNEGQVHCALIMGKSRVVPLKSVTVPRLELVAALLSVKIAMFLHKELDYETIEHFYWTDSQVVLGYISNESRRFHVFVANRVQQIRNFSEPSQWHHIGSNENPADIASRGMRAEELVKSTLWLNGPDFLQHPTLTFTKTHDIPIDPSDPEVRAKGSQCFLTEMKHKVALSSLLERLQQFSNWHQAKRAVALCLRLKSRLRQHFVKKPKAVNTSSINQSLSQYKPPSVSELREAELMICKLAQASDFQNDINALSASNVVSVPADKGDRMRSHTSIKDSHLRRLDPFLDSDGLLRIGGRLQNANVSDFIKHPIVLPRKSHLTNLLIRHFHEKCLHQGRGITTNEIRNNGFWIIGCSSAVSTLLSTCVTCRRLRATTQEQKMSELPVDRLEPAPPFTYCAVDLFGPFFVREGRKELKRYGVLFTCLACRAVHVETANSLETDSFICALRRFIAVRGPIRQLRSDRGTNFVGAEHELLKAVNELDEDKIAKFLLGQGCDMFSFKMNVPSASHMGGVWERQIRSVRSVLSALLHNHGLQLDDESLRTFLSEAAAVVNCRPLTVENLNDPKSDVPLTPNQLLTMKSRVILPPPGNFQREDIYSRKRWRRTQYLVEQFWNRWRVEYLQNLQVRNKWFTPRRNMQIGDIVLVKEDNLPRNQWRMGRLVDTTIDDDGLVRKVKIAMSDSDIDSQGKRKNPVVYLERPVQKVILLQTTEVDPVKEPFE